MDIDRPPRSPRRRRGGEATPSSALPPRHAGFRIATGLVPGGQDAWMPRPPAIDEPGAWAGAALAAPVGCPFTLEGAGAPSTSSPFLRPPPAAVPMIAAGSVYVVVDGLGAGAPGDAGPPPPALDDFTGAARLVERLLLHATTSTAGPAAGPGGRCASTGLLAFYSSPEAAEEAAARGLAAALVGGEAGGLLPPPPPLPPPPSLLPSSSTAAAAAAAAATPPLITTKASVLRPPTDALQRQHWGGRAAAAAWAAAARAATAERVAAAAARAALAARGVRPADAGGASSRRPPDIVAIPLGVALEATSVGGGGWATLTPTPPAWPGEEAREAMGEEKRPWWQPGRRDDGAQRQSKTTADARPSPPSSPPPPPAASASSAPAYALPCTCVLVDTPAGPVGFIPTFLDMGVLRRTWGTYVEASARWWLTRRALKRGEWRAGVEAGAVAAFGTGGRLVAGGHGRGGGPDDDGDEAHGPPKPPGGGGHGGGGIRDKDDDPPEVKEMEAALRSAVAAAMGGGSGGAPPWARGTNNNNRRGPGRPPPWAGAPRPVQAVLALAATAATGAVCAAARAWETVGDVADEVLIRTPLVGPAVAGLPSTRPIVVETSLGGAARAASFFNGMNARIVGAGVAAGRWPPPPAGWQGVSRAAGGGGGGRGGGAGRPTRLAAPAAPSVAALSRPATAAAGVGGADGAPAALPPPPSPPALTTSAFAASSPAASWTPPPWESVIGAVMQGVDYMVDAKMRELVWARLHQLGLGRAVGLAPRDWAREQREKQLRRQQEGGGTGLPAWPAPLPPTLAPPAVLAGDARTFRRYLQVAGEFVEAGEQAGFAPPPGGRHRRGRRHRRPDLMLSTVGALLRGRGTSFDTRIGGTGLLLVGDVGADGSPGLPWPWPDPAYGDAAALVPEDEEEGGAWRDGDDDDDDDDDEEEQEGG